MSAFSVWLTDRRPGAFAVSFAFVSVAAGIFGTYDDLLRNSGLVGILTWLIATVGQVLLALMAIDNACNVVQRQ